MKSLRLLYSPKKIQDDFSRLKFWTMIRKWNIKMIIFLVSSSSQCFSVLCEVRNKLSHMFCCEWKILNEMIEKFCQTNFSRIFPLPRRATKQRCCFNTFLQRYWMAKNAKLRQCDTLNWLQSFSKISSYIICVALCCVMTLVTSIRCRNCVGVEKVFQMKFDLRICWN